MSAQFISSFAILLVVLVSSSFAAKKSLYDFQINDIAGQPVNLAELRGKTLLIVNTACQCGYTDSHLKALNRLHRLMADDNLPFEILAFPCNDFGGQDPWEPEQIDMFIRSNYQWRFPGIMEKVEIVGENPHPFWDYIIETSSVEPTWNFHKYLFDSNGKFVKAWGAETSVQSIYDEIKKIAERSGGNGDRRKAEL